MSDNDWILNSAVTHHFCIDEILFEILRSVKEKIHLANKDIVYFIDWRSIRFFIYANNDNLKKINKLYFTDVIYASALNVNLLSSSILVRDLSMFCLLVLFRIYSQILKKDEFVSNMILFNNFYLVDLAIWNSTRVFATVAKLIKQQAKLARSTSKLLFLWHCRLNHIKKDLIRSLKNLANNIIIKESTDSRNICKSYVKDKIHKKSLTESDDFYHHSKSQFDLVHSDICEFLHQAHDEFCYFIIFVDDLIRAVFAKCFIYRD